MNKRWNDRKPASLNLVINYPALGLLRGKAVNISHDGMFIETAAISLCNHSTIELTLILPELSETPIQIQAIIIHNNDNGIGIMFQDHEKNSVTEMLHQLVIAPADYYQQAC